MELKSHFLTFRRATCLAAATLMIGALGCATGGRVEQLEIRLSELQGELEEARNSAGRARASVTNRVEEVESSATAAKSTSDAVATSLRDLEQALRDAQAKIDQQMARHNELMTKYDAQVNQIGSQIDDLVDLANRFQAMNVNYVSVTSNLQSELSQLRTGATENREQLNLQEQNIERQRIELTEKIDQENRRFRQELDQTNFELQDFRTRMATAMSNTREALSLLGRTSVQFLADQQRQFERIAIEYSAQIGTLERNLPDQVLSTLDPDQLREVNRNRPAANNSAPPAPMVEEMP